MTKDLNRREHWKVLWVSRDQIRLTRQYCERNGIPTEVVLADPVHITYDQLGLELVPHMIVVNSAGKVEKVWEGRLESELKKQVLVFFGMPGLGVTSRSSLLLEQPPVPRKL